LEWRAKLKASSDAELGLISLNDLILFAVARSLISHPQLNCWLENHTLQQFSRVNLGFAVDTPRGLLVPVVKEAQGLGLRELARQTKQLAAKCQEGHIEPQALQDGTFTVSNLGQFGIEQFTPILYPPQVGILGVGSINLKPIQTPNGIEFQPHLALSLTVNHQAVDGAPAARFLQSLSHNLADLTLLLALGA
jgi:pyruvate dehydrogenase E2 component (dihydrolipoamide acetyltransferase)